MAISSIATAQAKAPRASQPVVAGLVRCVIICLSAAAAVWPAPGAAADKVRITNLTDVAFGTVANLSADAVRAQSVCLYSASPTNGYHVTAAGTGAGGNFELSSGTSTLPFDVAWNSAPGQSSGTLLSPNVPLTGQLSTATQQTCNSGPATTASLIIILRSGALSQAMAGDYSGTLTLVVAPE